MQNSSVQYDATVCMWILDAMLRQLVSLMVASGNSDAQARVNQTMQNVNTQHN